jgi:glycosyltransferase involved in cell wall biosynthesis
MKKRIAIWIHGGIGTGHFSQGYPLLEQLIKRLAEPFDIVVYSQFAPNIDYEPFGFSIRSAPASAKWKAIRWLYLVNYFFWDHRKHKFDFLGAFWGFPAGWFATVMGKIMHLPSALFLLGGDSTGIASIDHGIFHMRWHKILAVWAYEHASELVVLTAFQKKQLIENGIRKAVRIVPWGADSSLFVFQPRIQGSVLHFIHVGHLTPVKDQKTLLRTFALVRKNQPSELRVFGVDRLNGSIQEYCNELGISDWVRFYDVIPYDQMPQHYAWSDVMLHTSLSEGQSMAVTEAAACGVLIAGTRVGLLFDLGEEYAVTVDIGDDQGLAKKIIELTGNRNSWNRKIQNAKTWSESHDLSWTANQLITVFNEL